MKRTYEVGCSIAFLLILLQANVIDSRRSRGGSRSRSRFSSFFRSHFGSSSSHSSSSGSRSRNSPEGSRSESSKAAGSSTNSFQSTKNTFPSKHHPENPGYFSLHSNHGGESPWDPYNAKPWWPKPPKTKLKHVAGASVGDGRGFLLGRTMSNMEFRFRNLKEEQWWHEHRNRYSDRVYFPNYNQYPVPKEVFVRDCVNVTVREFIGPSGNQTDEMETKVVTYVVCQMCREEYCDRFSRCTGGGNSGKISKMTNTTGAVITSIKGGTNGGHARAVAPHISFLMMPFFPLTKLLCY